jgi:hypothetical protein
LGLQIVPDLRFDHIVVAGNLVRNARALRAAGFTLEDGGGHDAAPTRNLLAAFDESSYIELLDFSAAWLRPSLRLLSYTPLWRCVLSGRPLHERVFLSALTRGRGPAAFAIAVDDLESFASKAVSRGLKLAMPVRMSRLRPDGVRVEWSLAMSPNLDLPFFLQDHTSRFERMPGQRSNSSDPVRAVRIAAPSVRATVERYKALLGLAPVAKSEGVSQFDLGSIRIEIAQGRENSTPAIDCELCSGRCLSTILEQQFRARRR